MKLAFEQDAAAAKAMAAEVLAHCGKVDRSNAWSFAAMGEANLYLGDSAEALSHYTNAVAQNPEPWQMKSMFVQATRVAGALDDQETEAALRRVFREEGLRSLEQG